MLLYLIWTPFLITRDPFLYNLTSSPFESFLQSKKPLNFINKCVVVEAKICTLRKEDLNPKMKELEEAEVKKKCALFLKDVWDKKKINSDTITKTFSAASYFHKQLILNRTKEARNSRSFMDLL